MKIGHQVDDPFSKMKKDKLTPSKKTWASASYTKESNQNRLEREFRFLPELSDRVKINALCRLTSDDTLHLIGDKTDYDQHPQEPFGSYGGSGEPCHWPQGKPPQNSCK
uniref:Uncharacterized protein n=1 Tax=Romanomermis culicivorax TaxID=13658 RepID=A0A915K2W4_ROMCU